MKIIKKLSALSMVCLFLLSFSQCKTQVVENETPFTIIEKTYNYWVSGKKGTNGVSIKIVGNFNTTSLGFSAIYFQNREYKIVPRFQSDKFTLIGNYSVLNTAEVLFETESKNEVAKTNTNIPFELEKDEAILVYSINGKNNYHKIKGVKKMETVYQP